MELTLIFLLIIICTTLIICIDIVRDIAVSVARIETNSNFIRSDVKFIAEEILEVKK